MTSFVRPDRHRADVRVYVTLWDPRQIALHMEAGTVEPISATGEHGSGMVPRVPEVMDHVVAAFNGGFQAQHGEYGMQANGIEYLPPKPYAATVVEFRNGANGFGAWPGVGDRARTTSSACARTSPRSSRTASSTRGDARGGAARRRAGPTRSTRREARSA